MDPFAPPAAPDTVPGTAPAGDASTGAIDISDPTRPMFGGALGGP